MEDIRNERERYNDTVASFCQVEYPMVQDSVYLDHAGSTLPAKSTLDDVTREMTSVLYGNPHSASIPSQQSASAVEDVRLRLLDFFNADPRDFDLVFVANATAGIKLVTEGLRSLPGGFVYAYHQACHTSIVGVREEAVESTCFDDDGISSWIQGDSPLSQPPDTAQATLIAYSAQSHMDGQRYPLSWSKELRNSCHAKRSPPLILLDAASLVSTSPLDLSDVDAAPDFTVLSLYKIFGFPDLGALIVRKPAESVFRQRRYFGGGTVDMAVCGKEQWHAPKSQFLHERLEDGTLPFHSIVALNSAMTTHSRLYGSMNEVAKHTSYLQSRLRERLARLRHGNGQPVCTIYTPNNSPLGSGPIVSFNMKCSNGTWISVTEVEKLTALNKMHVRTGSLCCPGGAAAALRLEPWEMKRNFSAGFKCGSDNDIVFGKPTGMIRASLGAMSTMSDVNRFVDFVEEFFVEKSPARPPNLSPTAQSETKPRLRIKAVTVFPIKSCGGLTIPRGSSWEVRAEGLAWDREWCLVHRGSGQALSQKRYPRMALLKPALDFEKGVLRVDFRAPDDKARKARQIAIPLSNDPCLFVTDERQMPSRVCGEQIAAQTYLSDDVNGFFSDVLGVPCALARFPAGGRGLGSRASKASMQSHQQRKGGADVPGVPSPPESDSEGQRAGGKILLANESPILLIYSASVAALNEDIRGKGQGGGGATISEAAFRGNIIVEPVDMDDAEVATADGCRAPAAYSEDAWRKLRIGPHAFELLGACRRCQMVCVDQSTGEKSAEPYSTLAKTRRFDGKVYFGAHMRREPGPAGQCPAIEVGDLVTIEE